VSQLTLPVGLDDFTVADFKGGQESTGVGVPVEDLEEFEVQVSPRSTIESRVRLPKASTSLASLREA
jgi:hypothetical protein